MTADCYSTALPLALTCREDYGAFTNSVRELHENGNAKNEEISLLMASLPRLTGLSISWRTSHRELLPRHG